jgi:hypothetical protein
MMCVQVCSTLLLLSTFTLDTLVEDQRSWYANAGAFQKCSRITREPPLPVVGATTRAQGTATHAAWEGVLGILPGPACTRVSNQSSPFVDHYDLWNTPLSFNPIVLILGAAGLFGGGSAGVALDRFVAKAKVRANMLASESNLVKLSVVVV